MSKKVEIKTVIEKTSILENRYLVCSYLTIKLSSIGTKSMHVEDFTCDKVFEKNIPAITSKQLKKLLPNYNKLKEIVRKGITEEELEKKTIIYKE